MAGSKSPSQILMETMEDFSTSEPNDFIMVWTNTENEVVVKSNAGTVGMLGLLEYAKQYVAEMRIRRQ